MIAHEWHDGQPIYRQVRDRIVSMILDDVLKEGDPLPSVRHVAAEYRINPLTVLKAFQELADEGLAESRRGRGMSVNPAHVMRSSRTNEEVSRERVAEDSRANRTASSQTKRPSMTYIEACGLRKTYGGNVALHGIDLHIDEGRIVGPIGPNGAGKTTALNAIVGLTSDEGVFACSVAIPG